MEIIHVSAECYPVAKAGGLGDVVGALPKFQNQSGHISKVVMPMYRTKFLYENEWEVTHKGSAYLGMWWFEYTVIKEKTNKLGFDIYLVDINGLLDREKIYGYDDDIERFTSFQIAVVDWLASWKHQPDIVHVHDHHTALIPFMLKYSYMYQHLNGIGTVLTIHNAQYQGWMSWDKSHYIPHWDGWRWGMLDWKDTINPLASGIKCASKVTTVSWSYLEELRYMSNGLEALFEYEKGKCVGILNGIDTKVWDPENDSYLEDHYSISNADMGKHTNKQKLCDTFHLDINKPLMVFIGRLVGEKAADLLPQVIGDSIYHINGRMNFLVLGSGEWWVEHQLESMRSGLMGFYNAQIGYNEKLSHLMYAGADFLLMPSRVEPCGLNQMYAMRYGTVPVVRRTGGLRDTVIDYGEPNGYGVSFTDATVGDITHAVYRAVELYDDQERMMRVRSRIMELDFSWDTSAQQYIDVYNSILSSKANPELTIDQKMAAGRRVAGASVSADADPAYVSKADVSDAPAAAGQETVAPDVPSAPVEADLPEANDVTLTSDNAADDQKAADADVPTESVKEYLSLVDKAPVADDDRLADQVPPRVNAPPASTNEDLSIANQAPGAGADGQEYEIKDTI